MNDVNIDYKNANLPIDERVNDLLNRMTLEEKVNQMLSIYNGSNEPWEKALYNSNGQCKEEFKFIEAGLGHISVGNKMLTPNESAIFHNKLQKFFLENTRLGIPVISHEEALHGRGAVGATNFPQAIALGASWDMELVQEVYASIAKESRAAGAHQVLAPVFDIARDPRLGRTEEMFSEDPYMVSCIAKASIKGLQGDGETIDDTHVAATAKHFSAHGQPEGGINAAVPCCSERTAREVFYPPFKAAVDAGIKSIMPAYNELDGIPCHANKKLLKNILREEWGFEGCIVSDYSGIYQLITNHRIISDEASAAKKAIEAGVDVELPHKTCYGTLVQQVEEGLIDEELINESVKRVLKLKFELGLFENPFVSEELPEMITNSEEQKSLALKAAQRSIVLLKNEDKLLPINKEQLNSIAVVGPNAAECIMGNYGSEPSYSVSLLEGIKTKVGSKIEVKYALGCKIIETFEEKNLLVNANANGNTSFAEEADSGNVFLCNEEKDNILIEEAVKIVKTCDIAIVAVGENEFTCREGWSGRLGDRANLDLIGKQDELVKEILNTGVPTVVVLFHGRPNSINEISEKVSAILECGYLGQETGNAVADVLFGDVNPGGKLSMSVPRSAGHLPVYYNKKPSSMKNIYYFTSNTPLFPFGYGLSYTEFEHSNLMIYKDKIQLDESTLVSIDIKNVGKYKGDEVVQLYIRDLVCSITRPSMELKDFMRVTLMPGEKRTISFEIDPQKLSFLNEDFQQTIEPGVFEIMVGTSSIQYKTVKLEIVNSKY